MDNVEIRRGRIINLIYFAIIIVAFYLFMNYAFWLCFPFIFAFIVAALLQRPVEAMSRKTPLKRGSSSVVCVFALVIILAGLVFLIGFKLVDELKDFFNYIMLKLENTSKLIEDLETWLTNRVATMPNGLQGLLSSALDNLFEILDGLVSSESSAPPADDSSSGLLSSFSFSWLSGPLSGVISTASKIPSIIVGVVVSIVASCFFTIDFQKLTNFIMNQFSDEKRENFTRAKVLLKSSLGKMCKAYALIIAITFVEMSIGLSVLSLAGIYNSGYIVVISVVTAFVDIMPILGTGTILVPWAVVSLLLGNIGMGIGLLIIYAVITIIRQIIEPKLVAGQLGLPPIITLAGIFFGLKLLGVLGMFIMPIIIVMIKLLNDEGIIKLWKPIYSPDTGEPDEPGFVKKLSNKIINGKKKDKPKTK